MKYLILAALIFSGCGSDDGGSSRSPLLGFWSRTQVISVFEPGDMVAITAYEFTQKTYKRRFVSQTAVTGLRVTDSEGTYTFDNGSVTLHPTKSTCINDADVTHEFSVEGTTLNLSGDLHEREDKTILPTTTETTGCPVGTEWIDSPMVDL